uniref:Uncharacterized protein n=1 Tax=Phytophthora infestans TaxID=4787 RepID=Q572H8_PHYIN|nr:hypothetical protein PI49.0050c [Phytophthora infestans]
MNLKTSASEFVLMFPRSPVLNYMNFSRITGTCCEMWANQERVQYFTAWNTTTNLIETNWNQQKRLLGRQTRIDRAIAGLLQNQVKIVNHLLLSLRKSTTEICLNKERGFN